MKNRLGLSSTFYAVRGDTVYDSVRKTADLGFEIIELGAAHAYEPGLFDTLKMLRKDFPETAFLVHALFPPQEKKLWFNASDGLTAQNKLIIDNLVLSAEIIGAQMFSIHCPIVDSVYMSESEAPGGFNRAIPGKQKEVAAAQKGFIETMDYIDPIIKRSGLKMAIENMDNVYFHLLLDSSADFMRVFDLYPWAGLLLDIAHSKRSGNTGELACLGDHIMELHIHDNKDYSKKDTWGHFALDGTGLLDEIKDELINNDRPIILEHGNEVSEKELILEKKMIEDYIKIGAAADN